MTPEDIQSIVTYHPPTQSAKDAHEAVRLATAAALQRIVASVPEGRERSIAITKAEEAMFWANAGIARNHELLEGRKQG